MTTLQALLEQWEARSKDALPTDAMLINKHIRELRTSLEQPIIQNQIVKDISRKPCHACANYEQGKRTGVGIHDETCYGCSEYYTNKWEAA